MSKEKLIIYQVLPRLLTNTCENPEPGGSLERNGSGKLTDYTSRLLKSIKDLGVNAIWYTGIIEMATKTDFSSYGIPSDNSHVVKGEAGSPYAIKDYFDVSPALASDIPQRKEEFKELIKRTHNEGLKVFIDFVPNHTARYYHSDSAPANIADFGVNDDVTHFFSPENDYYYITNQRFSPGFEITTPPDPYIEFPAKATGNDCFTAFPRPSDWYETVKLNYGKDYGDGSIHFHPMPPVWGKMLAILRYWASMGVDGFRCDMVFMVPLDFWHWIIPELKKEFPHLIFIGEIYEINLYRPFLSFGCFDYLYDKVGLYDTLSGICRYGYSAARLTGCWQAVDGIGGRMLNFLENHDEVRFGSEAYSGNPAYVLPYLVTSAMYSTGPFMIYFGQELGESAKDNEGFAGYNNRTTIFDYWSYDSIRRWYANGKCDGSGLNSQEKWLRDMYSRVLGLCNSEEAIREGGFYDLIYANLQNAEFDPHSVFAFIRHSATEKLLILANFSHTHKSLGLNIPPEAFAACGIHKGKVMLHDLLTNREKAVILSPSELLRIEIQGDSALVLKIRKSTELSIINNKTK